LKNALIKIVYDEATRKLRATPVDATGWVRFPRNLRIVGALYLVEELKEGKSGSWIACGGITRVQAAKVDGQVKKKKKRKLTEETIEKVVVHGKRKLSL